jgi:hypothetical protein
LKAFQKDFSKPAFFSKLLLIIFLKKEVFSKALNKTLQERFRRFSPGFSVIISKKPSDNHLDLVIVFCFGKLLKPKFFYLMYILNCLYLLAFLPFSKTSPKDLDGAFLEGFINQYKDFLIVVDFYIFICFQKQAFFSIRETWNRIINYRQVLLFIFIFFSGKLIELALDLDLDLDLDLESGANRTNIE